MLDVILVVLTLAASAPEMGQAVMEAAPPTISPEERATRDLAVARTAQDAAAARVAEIEAHKAWHAEQEAAAKAAAAVPSGSVWDRLAQCESGGNWAINTGNGYYGGLQFNLQTWRAYGGTGYPHQHSREVQIAVAERLRAARGFQPWPACSRKLGLL